ncbi:hypothetical protein BKA70DRAFT_1433964 [Coprinopsis sp. MPI-PUGE-AT-0042]|nr:hypothetical protein BKA70DRAFT_1433964 [Coprinopsis sp. MPI-PUGE-AT-0042]
MPPFSMANLPEEVTSLLVGAMDFESLLAWSAVHRSADPSIHVELLARLKRTVGRFVLESHIALFLLLLRQYGAAIIGWAALDVLLGDRKKPIETIGCFSGRVRRFDTLEISLPKTGFGLRDFQGLFEAVGFVDMSEEVPDPYLRRSVLYTYVGYKHLDNERVEVMITVASGNPLMAAMDTPSTFLINAITADRIYCFYPRLTLRGEGLHHWMVDGVHGFKSYESNAHWTNLTCDVYCPEMRRKTADDQAVLVYKWTGPLSAIDVRSKLPLPLLTPQLPVV